MIFLLDVNALLAMQYEEHIHHARVKTWASQLVAEQAHDPIVFVTCPITELGFVRVSSGKAGYAASVEAARADLQTLRFNRNMAFIPASRPAHELPAWVRKSAQTTDGYLLELAKAHDGRLATLDRFIPDALLIPDENTRPMTVRDEAVPSEWAVPLAHGASDLSGSAGIVIR